MLLALKINTGKDAVAASLNSAEVLKIICEILQNINYMIDTCCVWFSPNAALCITAKHLHSGLVFQSTLLPLIHAVQRPVLP